MRSSTTFIAGVLAIIATPLAAEIRFSFKESAPKDSFSITNGATCATGPLEVTIDLSTSTGKLIFDTSDTGAGVEVFQPFDLIKGDEFVLSTTPIADGDDKVQMSLSNLAPGAEIVFTIDVDDQLANGALGQIRVAGAEIEGALAIIAPISGDPVTSVYDQGSQAVLAYDACA